MEKLPLTPFLAVYCAVLSLLLGACLGSFLNCLAWRTVHGESVMRGRSHCDTCGHVLSALDLIPVVSYLVTRGRCRYCGAELSRRHLWAECVSALVFFSLFARYGLSFQTLEFALLACVLLACSFADLEGMMIPDRFLLAGFAVRMAFVPFGAAISGTLLDGLLGVAVAAALMGVVLVYEKVTKKEAMGGGDLKLLALIGLYFGWIQTLLCLMCACVFGLMVGIARLRRSPDGESAPFPFGPSIALGAWATVLFGQPLVTWYAGLLG